MAAAMAAKELPRGNKQRISKQEREMQDHFSKTGHHLKQFEAHWQGLDRERRGSAIRQLEETLERLRKGDWVEVDEPDF